MGALLKMEALLKMGEHPLGMGKQSQVWSTIMLGCG